MLWRGAVVKGPFYDVGNAQIIYYPYVSLYASLTWFCGWSAKFNVLRGRGPQHTYTVALVPFHIFVIKDVSLSVYFVADAWRIAYGNPLYQCQQT